MNARIHHKTFINKLALLFDYTDQPLNSLELIELIIHNNILQIGLSLINVAGNDECNFPLSLEFVYSKEWTRSCRCMQPAKAHVVAIHRT